MKFLCIATVFLIGLLNSSAENLSDVDRETILEHLQNIQEKTNGRVNQKYRAAISAYNAAMSSDKAALAFYLKCEDKVNFDDKKKKYSDYREWREKEAEKLSDAGFKLALRYQLQWLVICLKASSEDADREQLGSEAARIFDSVISQASNLANHRNILSQSVTSSIFARAYDINGLEVKDWPLSLGQIEPIYQQIIFPPLRRIDRISLLKSAWEKRISQEISLVKYWKTDKENSRKSFEKTAEYEKFIKEALPKLRWESEVDYYKAGDEKGAALRMIKHIEENITNKAAPKWGEQLEALLQGKEEVAVDPEGADTIETEPANPEKTQ